MDEYVVLHRYWCASIKYDPVVTPERVIEMGKLGYTKAQMASALNISKKTLWQWQKEHEEFKAAMELALTHAQAKKETELDAISSGEKIGNINALTFAMRHQFKDDYTEVKQINKTNTLNVNTLPEDQLTKQIAAKLKLLSPAERAQMLPLLNHVEAEFEPIINDKGPTR